MPFRYDYKCEQGHVIESSTHAPTITCHYCGAVAKRVYTPFATTAIQIEPAYNPSLGRMVYSKGDMMDGFKEASDKASERFGVDVKYSPVDLKETGPLGVTKEGLSSKAQDAVKD